MTQLVNETAQLTDWVEYLNVIPRREQEFAVLWGNLCNVEVLRMEPKLIVLDVDGTLLTSDNRILRSTRRVLASAQEAGHQIVLASGRFPGGLLPILADLSLEDSPYIASNGALIGRAEEILHQEICPADALEEAVTQAREEHLSVNVYRGMEWQVMDWRDEVAKEAAEVGCQPTLVDALTLEGVNKVMIIAEPTAAAT